MTLAVGVETNGNRPMHATWRASHGSETSGDDVTDFQINANRKEKGSDVSRRKLAFRPKQRSEKNVPAKAKK